MQTTRRGGRTGMIEMVSLVRHAATPVKESVEVMPRVWVGGADAQDRPPATVRVTHVVNCASGECAAQDAGRDSADSYLLLAAEDAVTYDLLGRHLAAFTAFVDDALRSVDAVVFVHCVAGENRSVCLATAYPVH